MVFAIMGVIVALLLVVMLTARLIILKWTIKATYPPADPQPAKTTARKSGELYDEQREQFDEDASRTIGLYFLAVVSWAFTVYTGVASIQPDARSWPSVAFWGFLAISAIYTLFLGGLIAKAWDELPVQAHRATYAPPTAEPIRHGRKRPRYSRAGV